MNLLCNNRILFLSLLISLFSPYSYSGEITDIEWDFSGDLKVTYFVGKSGQSIQVDCTAINEQKKPIGGGYNFAEGGVAVVRIPVPTKYQKSDKLKIVCRP